MLDGTHLISVGVKLILTGVKFKIQKKIHEKCNILISMPDIIKMKVTLLMIHVMVVVQNQLNYYMNRMVH